MSRIMTYNITVKLQAETSFNVEAHDEDEAHDLAEAYIESHIAELALEAAEDELFEHADAEVIEVIAEDDDGGDEIDWPEDDWDRDRDERAEDDRADSQRDDELLRSTEALGALLTKVTKAR